MAGRPLSGAPWPFAAVRARALLRVGASQRPNDPLWPRVECAQEEWELAARDETDTSYRPTRGSWGWDGHGERYLHVPP